MLRQPPQPQDSLTSRKTATLHSVSPHPLWNDFNKIHIDRATLVPTDQLLAPHIRHTFLFRSPAKAVPSYYRLCIPPASAKTGFEYFDPEGMSHLSSAALQTLTLVSVLHRGWLARASRALHLPIFQAPGASHLDRFRRSHRVTQRVHQGLLQCRRRALHRRHYAVDCWITKTRAFFECTRLHYSVC